MMDKPIPTEYEEQVAFVAWARMCLPEPVIIISIPNERKSKPHHMVKLKKSGLATGSPDLFISWARLGFHGLFIEMKRSKGGKVSDKQKEVHDRLKRSGYAVVVAYGANEAIDATKKYTLGNGDDFYAKYGKPLTWKGEVKNAQA